MPSRKKAKGKARKAAKEAKAKEEGSQAVVAEVAASQQQAQEESHEAVMQRLRISAPSPTMCRHGYPPLSTGDEKICLEFINAFITIAVSRANVAEGFCTALEAADAAVYSSKLDTVISMVLARGTQLILEGDTRIARLYASLTCYLEDFKAVGLHKTRAAPNLTKLVELYSADDHTLVSYCRNRISCSCLDEKYKEVKSVKKMGLCYNSNCSHPDGRVERSKMFSCARCGEAYYCSVGCQRADWKIHRQFCDKAVKKKAAFEESKES